MKRFLMIVLSSLLVSSLSPVMTSASPGKVRASLELEKKEATVGEKVTSRLVLEGPEGILFEIQNLKASLIPFSVADLQEKAEERVDGRIRKSVVFSIAAFETGSLEVPAVEIAYSIKGTKGSVKTEKTSLNIKSVLKSGQEEMADIKGPSRIPPDYSTLLLILLLLAASAIAAALVYLLIRQFKRRRKIAPLEDIFSRMPPHEWAYSELDKLLSERLLEKGLVKDFYAALSAILKKYLEGRYRINAMERTTEEVTGAMFLAKIEREVRGAAESILRRSDLVKFARHRPEHDESKAIIQEVYSFIDRTKPRYEEVDEEKIAAGGGGT
ncbi:MAG: hypothetical protein AB1756_10500 [Acidobacteriota bacterium]